MIYDGKILSIPFDINELTNEKTDVASKLDELEKEINNLKHQLTNKKNVDLDLYIGCYLQISTPSNNNSNIFVHLERYAINQHTKDITLYGETFDETNDVMNSFNSKRNINLESNKEFYINKITKSRFYECMKDSFNKFIYQRTKNN